MTDRKDRREPYTRRMLGSQQHVSVLTTRKIIRSAAPETNSLYFDDRGNLVLITGVRHVNAKTVYTWRRVFTNGETSRASYYGVWLEQENIVK